MLASRKECLSLAKQLLDVRSVKNQINTVTVIVPFLTMAESLKKARITKLCGGITLT